jgi:predicted O-methyltransferase YrrM
MAMCDASFIPIEQLKELLKTAERELIQEDYIALREKIEKDNPEIESKIKAVIERDRLDEYYGKDGSPTDTEKEKFEKKLVDYAAAQMEYNREEVKEKLKNTATKFLAELPSLKQKTIKDHVLTIERHLAGYYATWILDIGLKAGLFDAIAKATSASGAKPAISVEELSWQLGLTPLYVEVWCRAAYGLELLDVDESSGYRLAPGIKNVLLDSTHPMSMRFDIAFSTALHQDFLDFPTYLRTGEIWPLADRPAELHKLYVEATMDDYPVITDVILPAMVESGTLDRLKTSDQVKILDVGTGAGYALIHYAREFPNAHVIGLDKDPSCVAAAQRTVQIAVAAEPDFFKDKKHDNNSRITVRQQDVTTLVTTDPEKYDLIVINLVLYQIGISEYKNVFDRLHSVLNADGIMVISEYHFPELAPERTYRFPGYQSFLSHLLHFALTGATLVPSKTLVDLLRDAKFEIVRMGVPQKEAIHHPLEERQMIVAKRAEDTAGSSTA